VTDCNDAEPPRFAVASERRGVSGTFSGVSTIGRRLRPPRHRSIFMGRGRRRWREPAQQGGAIDPFADSGGPRAERKTKQLCRQAAESLGDALAEFDDERLRDVWIVVVEPAPDASRLCAVVRAPPEVDPGV